MKLFSETISAGVNKYIKKPLGNAAMQEAIAQGAKVLNELNGEVNIPEIKPIMTGIRDGLMNHELFDMLEQFIVFELHNYYYQNWTQAVRAVVIDSVVNALKPYIPLMQESVAHDNIDSNFHIDCIQTIVYEISQAIKKAIMNKLEDPILEAAINAGNSKEVCASLGMGADASAYIHKTITDPTKTHLLIYLLRAGVNPSDVYHIEGLTDVFDVSLNSVSKFLGTPIALGKKIAIEVVKRGFNLISLVAYYENVEAMKILLESCHAIYYKKQLEDALQDQIGISGKFNQGNALTVSLMNATSEHSQNVAVQLIRAGSNLNTIKGGSAANYSDYNNLQLIIIFKLHGLLYEALSFEKKSKSYQYALFDAMQYQSASARQLVEANMPDMLASYDAVYVLLKTQDDMLKPDTLNMLRAADEVAAVWLADIESVDDVEKEHSTIAGKILNWFIPEPAIYEENAKDKNDDEAAANQGLK